MMNKITFTDILVPTDFSKLSGNALVTAAKMCKRHNATLHVMHVVENRLMVVPPEVNMPVFYVVPEMENTGRKNLAILTEKIKKKYKITVQPHIGFGNPADSVRDKAIELKCQLIIMGTHGSSGFREFFIGNTAYSLIKNTTIPVLTIPGKMRVKDFSKILFPIRAANGILSKYDFIESLIEKNNSELVILGLSLTSEIFSMDDRKKELLELGKSLQMNSTRFRSEFHVCKNYAKKVLAVAKKEKVDLIVINATLGYTWSQFFVGPYAQQIVNHARLPVLSIRPADPAPVANLRTSGNRVAAVI